MRRDAAAGFFSPPGRRWPEGSDEGAPLPDFGELAPLIRCRDLLPGGEKKPAATAHPTRARIDLKETPKARYSFSPQAPTQAACLPISPGISTGSISSEACPAVASLVCIQVISSKLPSAFSAIAVQLSTQSPVLM